jgi:endonuclease I/PKD repeat protein
MKIETGIRRWLLCCIVFVAAGYAHAQVLPPSNYYVTTTNLTGTTLKSTLHEIIKGHTVIPYSSSDFDTHDALVVLDQDPTNSANVTLIYSGYSVAASTWPSWNREHMWPESYGTDSGTQHSDLFNLRACAQGVNSSRNNKYYDVSTAPISHYSGAPDSSYDGDSWEPRDADKGLVARACFYMTTRYDGTGGDSNLQLTDSPNASSLTFAKLSTLLDWNRRFPPTDWERTRNSMIATNYQHNRNPFIDNPDFADMIFLGVDGFAAWEATHFPGSESALSGAGVDPDGDGLPNLLEYALGDDPLTPDPGAIISLTMQTVGGTNYLYITHYKNHYASGISFGYEVSTNLPSWTSVTPAVVSASQIDPQRDLVTVSVPAIAPSELVRLRIHRLADTPEIVANGATITVEECTPANGTLDPGESVTVSFSLRNVGSVDTSNLVATLLATGGVTSPSDAQNYGRVTAGGPAVSRSFSFVANGDCGGNVTATFDLQDGATSLGSITYTFPLGEVILNVEDFDGITAPDLPADWTTSASGSQSNWVTSATQAESSPNAVFSPDPGDVGINELVTPSFFINSTSAQLTFQQNYSLTASATNSTFGYDGGVLEIKIGDGSFQDILAAGGSFASGGYNTTLSSDYSNPLSGRQAWSGNSGGFIATTVDLPAAAAGQNVQLRWRCGAGSSATEFALLDSGSFSGVLAGWDTSAQSAYGPSPFAATTTATNIVVGGLTRGSGVGTGGTGAARGWGGNGWTDVSADDAIYNDRVATFTIQVGPSSSVSFGSISKFDYRRSATGPSNGRLQYQVGPADSFHTITDVSYSSTSSSGASLGPVDLSSISALQNVPAGTVVSFRIANWGGTSSAGTWYIFDKADTTASDFEIQGTITSGGTVGGGWYIDSMSIQEALCCTITPPMADFTGSPTNGLAPLMVAFDDASTGTITNWFWDFGDGGTTNITTNSVVHTYAAGSYNVTLIVSGPDGVNTNTKTGYITAWTPFQTWQVQYFGSIDNPDADGSVDADGDGLNNLAEFEAGTDPTNSVSALRITSIARVGDDLGITWTTGIGKTNALQFTSGAVDGGYSNDFSDLFIVTNTTDTVTNYLDIGAANEATHYYRIRLVP